AVVAGLQRHVQMTRDGRRLAQGADELVVDVVDLDRRESEPSEPRQRAGLADEAREREARLAVAEAPQVDAGENDLAVTLRDPAPDLGEHVRRPAAARGAANERDHAERAGEAAAVLDLHEGAHAFAARVVANAADRADVGRDRGRRLLARLRNDDDV